MSDLGFINDRGEYIEGEDKPLGFDVSSQYKSWSHDNQRKRFGRDVLQPWSKGEPNPEFVSSYPEESKRYFSQDQINKAERNLGGMK